MTFNLLTVYGLSVVVLFLKFVVTVSVQARERLRTRGFRYPEDAAEWHGVVAADSELCERAERLLRNDAESQPYYLALGGLLLVVAPHSVVAPVLLAVYTAARVAHAMWLLRPRQPHRNRAYSLGLLMVFCMAAHVVWEVWGGTAR